MPELDNHVETQFDEYLFEAEGGGQAFADAALVDRSLILPSFVASPEYARLEPDDRELVWVQELLEAMESAEWDWNHLDAEMFEAVLLDGLGWAIDQAPADAGRVARVLDAFFSFAGREYGAPHAAACCAYLRSPGAVDDIARWLQPFEIAGDEALLARLSAPYNWCDARCDRCPLSATCPVHNFDDPFGGRFAGDEGDPEVNRAVALATAHALAAREAPALDDSERDRPEPAASVRLRHVCRAYAFAVLAVREALVAGRGDGGAERSEIAPDHLRADAMLVAVKGSRVACQLSRAGGLHEAALMDGAPNLLLLERLVAAIDARLPVEVGDEGCAAAYRAARDDLRRALQPLLRALPSRYREELQLRMLTGSAPSPFSSHA
jgi:hypothetical protein